MWAHIFYHQSTLFWVLTFCFCSVSSLSGSAPPRHTAAIAMDPAEQPAGGQPRAPSPPPPPSSAPLPLLLLLFGILSFVRSPSPPPPLSLSHSSLTSTLLSFHTFSSRRLFLLLFIYELPLVSYMRLPQLEGSTELPYSQNSCDNLVAKLGLSLLCRAVTCEFNRFWV